MPSRLWVSRSPTPVTMPPTSAANRPRWSIQVSTSRVPSPAASTWYSQRATRSPAAVTSKANSRPGSDPTTRQDVCHWRDPNRFLPRKRAPTTGPRCSPTHSQPVVSGENSPIRSTSETSAHTVAGAAATWRSTVTVVPIGPTLPVVSPNGTGTGPGRPWPPEGPAGTVQTTRIPRGSAPPWSY